MTTPLPDDPARWQAVKALFEEAVARPASERDAFLADACRGDDALRRAVEALLLADSADDAFLERGPASLLGHLPDLADVPGHEGSAVGPGDVVGPYRVVGHLGTGGMGEVFLAERADGLFEQHVALKLVKRGMDTDAVLRRFAAERRILARLEHPGIARLYAGGATDDGRPWFAMEYVEGEPLTEYVRERGLSLHARLGLFEGVCEAVRHAHARLVVHRDLKPSNVLVSEDDAGRPVVKLLDFGIARLLDDDAERSALTAEGAQPMTRAYAAPEQVRGKPATTATDVYALGMLLYELLTGHRPFEHAGTPAALEAAILEEEPARPSRRASEGGLPAARVRGDLDTIVLQALRKAPEERYAGADALLQDLRRHRDGLPLVARAPSVGYRARLFVRRHRTGVAVAAVAALLLLTGGIFYTSRVTAERDRAQEAAARAEATAGFLATLFERVDPTVAQGDTLSALELLDHGLARLDADLADAPLVQADLLDVMSESYRRLDDPEHARDLAERALALRRAHPDAGDPAGPARSLLRLADAEQALLNYPRADTLHREAVALRRAHGDVPALIDALQAYGWFLTGANYRPEAVEPVYDEVLALRRAHYGPDDPGLGLALHQFASAQHLTGNYARADSLHRLAIDSFRKQSQPPAELAEALHMLGLVLHYQHRYAAADSFLTESAALHEQIYGPNHSATLEVLAALGTARLWRGHLDEAEVLLDTSLARFERAEGPNGQGVTGVLSRMRQLYDQAGRPEEALAAATRMYRLAEAQHGRAAPVFAGYSSQYARALADAGRYVEAEAHLRQEVLPLMADAFGATSPTYAIRLRHLGDYVEAQGRLAEAERLFGEAYALLATQLPSGNNERTRTAFELGRLRAARGAHAEALPLLQEAAIEPGGRTPRPLVTATRHHLLGQTLFALGRFEEAERHFDDAHALRLDALGPDHADTRAAADARAECRRRLDRSP